MELWSVERPPALGARFGWTLLRQAGPHRRPLRPCLLRAGAARQPLGDGPAGDDVAAVREPWTSHPGAVIRSLVGLKHRPRQLLELSGGKDANERVLVSAAAVCFLTHVLTVQGLMLAGYLAAASAVPLGAMNHAISRRKAWPALAVLLPLLVVPNVPALHALYTSLVNPVSVQIKARITLPALVHAAVGSKHPLLRASMQYAKLGTQVVLLVALLQYLFAPRVAEAMRQRALMLCRAFTTTEAQGMAVQGGEPRLETWPNKAAGGGSGGGFREAITRGDARKLGGQEETERLATLRAAALQRRGLPKGQQPTFADAFEHADEVLSPAGAGRGERQAAAAGVAAAEAGGPLSVLEVLLESDSVQQAAAAGDAVDAFIEELGSPEQLLEALDAQLGLMRQLAAEVRSGSDALRESEQAREGLERRLADTLGEKDALGSELAALAGQFEAARGAWERQGASLAGLVTGEVLEELAAALQQPPQRPGSVLDGDALAARLAGQEELSIQDLLQAGRNNVQPFGRAPADAPTAAE